MKGAKRMSKRITTRKREKINKKVREHHRKVRKEARNKKKIPSSVFVTQTHREHLQRIKEDTDKRTKEFYENKQC
ncbi:hypothetical protein EHP00_688 [Ecytonucleospora hepatopenaei]|uniref:Guanine nucleotide-binding protein-like 3 N-terminal domain-containing protein n=1 Tax=Ecytonucleospora hepatopenaei TaxID=646526 RepID=A0A1W0E3R5_9MICR|nr:hypothetical protein EHP00_688 [Ecytonucleospora hepatopenaei]